ncbi:hypothetical protein [Treponema sp.]|uniref:hypothetical protein n=1 Tax=Treponema sp. TaxID=166 RepID=UPI003F0323A1
MIQLAAGMMTDAEQKKENLFKAFLEEIQKANQIKTQIQVDIVNSAWEFFFGKKTKSEKSANNSNKIKSKKFRELMETVKIDDLSSPCCDLYITRVLEIINRKPANWPSPSTYKVCNTPDYSGDNYKDFYASKWKTSPSEGWNIMIMWANTGEKYSNSPHMAIVQKKDNSFNLTHFTGNKQKIRENWTLAQVENGFDYSNFRYMPLGE